MMHGNKPAPVKYKKRIAKYTQALYLIVPAIGTIIFMLVAGFAFERFNDGATQEAVQSAATEVSLDFRVNINDHFTLMHQMAHSATVARWLANDYNEAARMAAFDEIRGYLSLLPEARLMFTAYETWNSYDFDMGMTFDEFHYWGQLVDDGSDQWFYSTRDADALFILNVQRERLELVEDDIVLLLWTNHRVYYQKEFVGVVTIGTPFDEIFDTTLGGLDHTQVRAYIIDGNGAVRLDSRQELQVHEMGLPTLPTMPEVLLCSYLYRHIGAHLESNAYGLFMQGYVPSDAVRLCTNIEYHYASVRPILGTSWSVVVLMRQPSLFAAIDYLHILYITLAVYVVFSILGHRFLRRVVLAPLYNLTMSVENANSDTAGNMRLYGIDRDDEIGYLANAISRSHEELVKGQDLLLDINAAIFAMGAVNNRQDLEEVLQLHMGITGAWLEVDRIQLVRAKADPEGVDATVLCIWESKLGQKYPKTDYNHRFRWGAFSKLEELVTVGGFFAGPVSHLPKEEQAFGNPHKSVRSTIILPLMLDGELWGCVTVDDCGKERYFPEDVINTIHSAALMAASTYRRLEQTVETTDAHTREKEARDREQVLRDRERVAMMELRAKIAEESNLAKSMFLARTSHELRTPISIIMGISEIHLQSAGLSMQVEKDFDTINSSANMLLNIVNDLLDHSKIESGKMTISQEKYETESLIHDVLQLCTNYSSGKGIEFEVHVDEDLPRVLIGDSSRIMQVVNNILSNAFKYTEFGSVKLYFHCKMDENDPERAMLHVCVIDTGLGMSDAQLANLYDEYARFHELGSRYVTGMGLGMTIVQNIVQMMGGKIDIKSEVGKGTHVNIYMPQRMIDDSVIGKDSARRLEQFESFSRATKKNIELVAEPLPYGSVLVVDDLNANLYVAKGLLSFYELHIETCNSGVEAIEKIKEGNVYDIIFMDQMMPGISGTETMQEMRRLGYNEPIVALTANAITGMAEEFLQEGFDGFMSKPIQAKRLNSILMQFIKNKRKTSHIEVAEGENMVVGEIDALGDFMNSDKLRQQLRMDFMRTQKDAHAKIMEALIVGDTKTAHLLAHSLKGVAGLIDQPALVEAAQEVEHVFINDKLPDERLLSTLEKELASVVEELGESYSESVQSEYDKLDVERALTLLNQLEPLLESQNLECMDFLEELSKTEEMVTLHRQVMDFDFGEALSTLQALKATFEETD